MQHGGSLKGTQNNEDMAEVGGYPHTQASQNCNIIENKEVVLEATRSASAAANHVRSPTVGTTTAGGSGCGNGTVESNRLLLCSLFFDPNLASLVFDLKIKICVDASRELLSLCCAV